jgi:hypothetical protein
MLSPSWSYGTNRDPRLSETGYLFGNQLLERNCVRSHKIIGLRHPIVTGIILKCSALMRY